MRTSREILNDAAILIEANRDKDVLLLEVLLDIRGLLQDISSEDRV